MHFLRFLVWVFMYLKRYFGTPFMTHTEPEFIDSILRADKQQ